MERKLKFVLFLIKISFSRTKTCFVDSMVWTYASNPLSAANCRTKRSLSWCRTSSCWRLCVVISGILLIYLQALVFLFQTPPRHCFFHFLPALTNLALFSSMFPPWKYTFCKQSTEGHVLLRPSWTNLIHALSSLRGYPTARLCRNMSG